MNIDINNSNNQKVILGSSETTYFLILNSQNHGSRRGYMNK